MAGDKLIQQVLEQMRLDAKIFDVSFSPTYDYKNSSLKQNYAELSKTDMTGIPPAIRDQVTNLESTYKHVVKDIIQGDFKESTWSAPFDAIQKSIAEAKETAKANPAAAAPGQTDEALDKLSEQMKQIKGEALNTEMQKMQRNLQIQNDMNYEKAMNERALAEGPYQGKGSLFRAKDWRLETGSDEYSAEEKQKMKADGVTALSTDAGLHKSMDGIYSQEDSKYKVLRRTDSNGTPSYEATYSHVPKGDFRTAGESLIDLAVMMIRFWGTATLVLPVLEAISVGLAGLGYVLTGGNFTPPYSLPFSQASKFPESIFDKREGTTRDAVKAEIDVAQRRGKEREIYFDVGGGKNKEIEHKDLEKAVVYLDELKQKAGYEVGPNGPEIKKPKGAMNFIVGTGFEDKLSFLTTSALTKETKKMVESFYKSQNNGSMSGYKESKFKEYILREIQNFQAAMAPLQPRKEARATNTSTITPGQGETNTSTITPTKDAPLSTIVPTKAAAPMPTSTIAPSAPPPPAELSPQDQMARAMAQNSLINGTVKVDAGSNFKETVKNGIDKLEEIVKENYAEKGVSKSDAGAQNCQDLKGNLDNAVKHLDEGEKQALEHEGTLEVYREANIRMGVEPAAGLDTPPAYQAPGADDSIGTIAASHVTRAAEAEVTRGAEVTRKPEVTRLTKMEVPKEDEPAPTASSIKPK